MKCIHGDQRFINEFNTTGGTKMNVAGKQTAADTALRATLPGSSMQFHGVSLEQKAKYPPYYKE